MLFRTYASQVYARPCRNGCTAGWASSPQDLADRLRERTRDSIRQHCCQIRIRLPRRRIALDENRLAADPSRSLNIRQRIANHHARRRQYVRKLPYRLLEQSCTWLPATTLLFVMWAEVESVYVCTIPVKMFLKERMQDLYIRSSIKAECYSALIAHDDDAPPPPVKRCNRLFNSGQHLKFTPIADVLPFRSLAVDHTIAIQEHALDPMKCSHNFEFYFFQSRYSVSWTKLRRHAPVCRGGSHNMVNTSTIVNDAMPEHFAAIQALHTLSPVLR